MCTTPLQLVLHSVCLQGAFPCKIIIPYRTIKIMNNLLTIYFNVIQFSVVNFIVVKCERQAHFIVVK
nr:MAG TPA: hypothetical protein [Caudoviricetes sp.]